jgi:hypothetical protein
MAVRLSALRVVRPLPPGRFRKKKVDGSDPGRVISSTCPFRKFTDDGRTASFGIVVFLSKMKTMGDSQHMRQFNPSKYTNYGTVKASLKAAMDSVVGYVL